MVGWRILNFDAGSCPNLHVPLLNWPDQTLDIRAAVERILVGPPRKPDDVFPTQFNRRIRIEQDVDGPSSHLLA
jgi:hypothetical protein